MSEGEHTPDKPKGLNRRDVLVKAAGLGAGIIAGFKGSELLETHKQDILDFLNDPQHTRDEGIRETREFIERVYGVRVLFGEERDAESYSLGGLTAYEGRSALTAFLLALYKYPPDFFKTNPLPPVRIGKDVVLNPPPEGMKGVTDPTTQDTDLLGFTAFDSEQIVLEYRENYEEFEPTVHHEIYHLLRNRYPNGIEERDRAWTELHEAAGAGPYRGEGWHLKPLDERLSSILASGYGAASIHEDRATMAEALLSTRFHYQLVNRVTTLEDPLLSKILAEEIEMIKQDYKDWSGGLMDEAYWLRMERAGFGQRAIVVRASGTNSEPSGFHRYSDSELTPESYSYDSSEYIKQESGGWFRN